MLKSCKTYSFLFGRFVFVFISLISFALSDSSFVLASQKYPANGEIFIDKNKISLGLESVNYNDFSHSRRIILSVKRNLSKQNKEKFIFEVLILGYSIKAASCAKPFSFSYLEGQKLDETRPVFIREKVKTPKYNLFLDKIVKNFSRVYFNEFGLSELGAINIYEGIDMTEHRYRLELNQHGFSRLIEIIKEVDSPNIVQYSICNPRLKTYVSELSKNQQNINIFLVQLKSKFNLILSCCMHDKFPKVPITDNVLPNINNPSLSSFDDIFIRY